MDVREKLVELCEDLETLPCCNTYEGQADYLIAHGVTVQKWIPVTERLPEKDGIYMCNVKSFSFPGKFYRTILPYVEGGFIEGQIYTDAVTHWMPLPEPPKENE